MGASPNSNIGTNWISLPVPLTSKTSQAAPLASPIPPGQVPHPVISASWKIYKKGLEDYESDWVSKYAQYFKDNGILPIPEVSKVLEPRILSLFVSDLKTRRLTGLQKDKFEEILHTAGIQCQYFCRRSRPQR